MSSSIDNIVETFQKLDVATLKSEGKVLLDSALSVFMVDKNNAAGLATKTFNMLNNTSSVVRTIMSNIQPDNALAPQILDLLENTFSGAKDIIAMTSASSSTEIAQLSVGLADKANNILHQALTLAQIESDTARAFHESFEKSLSKVQDIATQLAIASDEQNTAQIAEQSFALIKEINTIATSTLSHSLANSKQIIEAAREISNHVLDSASLVAQLVTSTNAKEIADLSLTLSSNIITIITDSLMLTHPEIQGLDGINQSIHKGLGELNDTVESLASADTSATHGRITVATGALTVIAQSNHIIADILKHSDIDTPSAKLTHIILDTLLNTSKDMTLLAATSASTLEGKQQIAASSSAIITKIGQLALAIDAFKKTNASHIETATITNLTETSGSHTSGSSGTSHAQAQETTDNHGTSANHTSETAGRTPDSGSSHVSINHTNNTGHVAGNKNDLTYQFGQTGNTHGLTSGRETLEVGSNHHEESKSHVTVSENSYSAQAVSSSAQESVAGFSNGGNYHTGSFAASNVRTESTTSNHLVSNTSHSASTHDHITATSSIDSTIGSTQTDTVNNSFIQNGVTDSITGSQAQTNDQATSNSQTTDTQTSKQITQANTEASAPKNTSDTKANTQDQSASNQESSNTQETTISTTQALYEVVQQYIGSISTIAANLAQLAEDGSDDKAGIAKESLDLIAQANNMVSDFLGKIQVDTHTSQAIQKISHSAVNAAKIISTLALADHTSTDGKLTIVDQSFELAKTANSFVSDILDITGKSSDFSQNVGKIVGQSLSTVQESAVAINKSIIAITEANPYTIQGTYTIVDKSLSITEEASQTVTQVISHVTGEDPQVAISLTDNLVNLSRSVASLIQSDPSTDMGKAVIAENSLRLAGNVNGLVGNILSIAGVAEKTTAAVTSSVGGVLNGLSSLITSAVALKDWSNMSHSDQVATGVDIGLKSIGTFAGSISTVAESVTQMLGITTNIPQIGAALSGLALAASPVEIKGLVDEHARVKAVHALGEETKSFGYEGDVTHYWLRYYKKNSLSTQPTPPPTSRLTWPRPLFQARPQPVLLARQLP